MKINNDDHKHLSTITPEDVIRNAKQFEIERKMGMTPKVREALSEANDELMERMEAYKKGRDIGRFQGMLMVIGIWIAVKVFGLVVDWYFGINP